MRVIKSLNDAEIVLKELNTKIDTFFSKSPDCRGRQFKNAGAATDPNDFVTLKQLPTIPEIPPNDPQHFAIVLSTTGPIVIGTQISAPYIVGDFRTGIPIWVYAAATFPPSGGPCSVNLTFNGVALLLSDLSIPDGGTASVKATNLVVPIPFFNPGGILLPTCSASNSASLVSIVVGMERRGPSLH